MELNKNMPKATGRVLHFVTFISLVPLFDGWHGKRILTTLLNPDHFTNNSKSTTVHSFHSWIPLDTIPCLPSWYSYGTAQHQRFIKVNEKTPMESEDDLGALLLLLLLICSSVVPGETNQGSAIWPKMWQADPQRVYNTTQIDGTGMI